MLVPVGVSERVTVAVVVPVPVAVLVAVPVPVPVLVGVSERVRVAVGVPVPVAVFVAVPVPVGVSVAVGVAVPVAVLVAVPVPVPVLVLVAVAEAVAVAVAEADGAATGVDDGDGVGATYASFMANASVRLSYVVCENVPWFGTAPPLTHSTPVTRRVRTDCTGLDPIRPTAHENLVVAFAGCRGVSNDKKYTTSGGNTHPAPVRLIVSVSHVVDFASPSGSVTLEPICLLTSMPHSGAWPRFM